MASRIGTYAGGISFLPICAPGSLPVQRSVVWGQLPLPPLDADFASRDYTPPVAEWHMNLCDRGPGCNGNPFLIIQSLAAPARFLPALVQLYQDHCCDRHYSGHNEA
jgi:hypothetical protein